MYDNKRQLTLTYISNASWYEILIAGSIAIVFVCEILVKISRIITILGYLWIITFTYILSWYNILLTASVPSKFGWYRPKGCRDTRNISTIMKRYHFLDLYQCRQDYSSIFLLDSITVLNIWWRLTKICGIMPEIFDGFSVTMWPVFTPENDGRVDRQHPVGMRQRPFYRPTCSPVINYTAFSYMLNGLRDSWLCIRFYGDKMESGAKCCDATTDIIGSLNPNFRHCYFVIIWAVS